MKTSFKLRHWLFPPFLRRLDDWLLHHYPDVWRTRAHYVLWLAVWANIGLFAAGYFYPVSVKDLSVHPDAPIRIWEEDSFLYTSILAAIGILFWATKLHQIPFRPTGWRQVWRTLLIYLLALFVILSTGTMTFKMGTIVQTAYSFLDEPLIDYAKANDYFLYGFIPLKEDSVAQYTVKDFQIAEARFKEIWEQENTILAHRYDKDFLLQLQDTIVAYDPSLKASDKVKVDQVEDLSYLSYLWDRSYLSYLSYRSYRSVLSDLSDRSDLSVLSDRSYLSYLSEYNRYYSTHIFPTIDFQQLETHSIPIELDTAWLDQPANWYFTYSTIPYLLEDGVRSVEHAQQYLQAGMVWLYVKKTLPFLWWTGLGLFLIPYFSFRGLLLVPVFLWGSLWVVAPLVGTVEETIIYYGSYLLIVYMVTLALVKKRKGNYLKWALEYLLLLFVALIIFEFFELTNLQASLFTETTLYVNYLISLLFLFFFPKIQALPKVE